MVSLHHLCEMLSAVAAFGLGCLEALVHVGLVTVWFEVRAAEYQGHGRVRGGYIVIYDF